MLIEVKVPGVGESVSEALLAQWFKQDGDVVKKDEALFVIETDKVTLEVVSEADGVLAIKVAEGETVAINTVVATIDAQALPEEETSPEPAAPPETPPEPAQPPPSVVPEMAAVAEKEAVAAASPPAEPVPAAAETPVLAPSVRRLAAETQVDLSKITATGPAGRITKGDVLLYIEGSPAQTAIQEALQVQSPGAAVATTAVPAEIAAAELVSRKPMTPIRRRIAARLLEAKQNTAMLTTFNEIDMSHVQSTRTAYKEAFKNKYGVSLGMMSFFIKAVIEALKEFPQINSLIDGNDIIEHHYYHIGVAVGSERGLVVPVIRHADKLSFAELEQAIVTYIKKINENRLELADLEGGTFTISNGGVFGSLLSTPILNMPQSGILGMHKIEKRPVVVNDEVVIRPMMYVALSYDHRIVDGREAVRFLKRIKECVEDPQRIIMEI
jgi:2-oxoglutarate dehydrogenase E2 component (dihydrolipoamide succinyltransferase)